MNIVSDVPIYKISNSVFQIGNIDYDQKFINTIASLLTLGNKFVPNYFTTNTQFIHFLLLDIDLKIIDFNKRLFFNSKNKDKNLNNFNSSKNQRSINLSNNSLDDIFFDNLFKSLNKNHHNNRINNKNNNNSCLFISKDTLNFRLELHKNLLYTFKDIDIKPNISYEQLKTIAIFQKNKPFKIIDCDKNVGLALISNELYEKNVIKYLNEDSTYSLINKDILPSVTSNINDTLYDLFNNGHISKRMLNKVKIKNVITSKFGSFRLLAKIHKPIFSWRPIINCRNNPTSSISNVIDNLLKPIIQRTDTILKDSQNLIQKCQNITFSKKPVIYSMDFSSLYSNMDQLDTANTLTDFMTPLLDSSHLSAFGFRSLLLLILNNNYFKYNSTIYKQIKGIAMGVICGPSLANLYLHIKETRWLFIHRPLFYGRFIDDIGYIDEYDLNLDEFKATFGNLELNITTGDSVVILDLIMKYDNITNKIKFSLYTKPTNNFGYLLNKSNHPEYIYYNIIKSLFIRIKRICTDHCDFIISSINLTNQLIQRGYDVSMIIKVFKIVNSIDRSSLLPYKDKIDIRKENDILFFNQFNYNIDLKTLIQKSFLNIKKEKCFLYDYNIRIINKINCNINRMFVHNFKLNLYKYKHTYFCDNIECFCCKFIYRKSSILLKDINFSLPLLNNLKSDLKLQNLLTIFWKIKRDDVGGIRTHIFEVESGLADHWATIEEIFRAD